MLIIKMVNNKTVWGKVITEFIVDESGNIDIGSGTILCPDKDMKTRYTVMDNGVVIEHFVGN